MPVKITKREPMSGEELHVSLDVPESDQQKFQKDPEAYIRTALEAEGQKVNGVLIHHATRGSLVKNASPQPMEYVVVHVESPKSKSASRHIVVKI